jgi:H+/Na+-translocating ferredoxin:NAD+ oxidoreductase subunit B
MQNKEVYKKLAIHLDHLPGGYPETETGVELRILEKLFTPEEASLAQHLTLLDEKPNVVAYRSGISLQKATLLLEGMARKGLIFFTPEPDGSTSYMAAQFVVGIWEMQVGYLEKELAEMFEAYLPDLFHKNEWKEVPQLRTVPVEQSINSELRVLPYERAKELIRGKSSFTVTPCICRVEKGLGDGACSKPLETCISFGTEEDYFASSGFGRPATMEEVLGILELADKKGLVIQPSNGKEVKWICCCCGCCCAVLRTIKTFPKPNELTSSPFSLAIKIDLCEGCKKCIKRCPMDAITVPLDKIAWEKDRCIGCGLCVTSCDSGALSLERKPNDELSRVPKNIVEASIKTLKLRNKARLPNLAMMLIRSKRDRFLARTIR